MAAAWIAQSPGIRWAASRAITKRKGVNFLHQIIFKKVFNDHITNWSY
jgi:hypothetical protein